MVFKRLSFGLAALCSLAVVMLGAGGPSRWGRCEARGLIDQGAAVAAAYREARRLGYDPANLQTSKVDGPTTYRAFVAAQVPRRVDAIADLEAQLGKKTFWCVWLSRKEKVVFGGSLEVFIDASTAEVLATLRGK